MQLATDGRIGCRRRSRGRDCAGLAYRALRFHGPLTAPQLDWWLTKLGCLVGAGRRALKTLRRSGRVRDTGKARDNGHGQLCKLWEAL
jgi:hypothetical protein